MLEIFQADLDEHRIMAFGVPPAYLSEIDWLLKVNRPDNNPRTPVLTINNVYGLRRAAQMGIGITTIHFLHQFFQHI